MWRAINPDGSLVYPSFVETVLAIRPMYIVRALGGAMYLAGFVMMVWNLIKTARAGEGGDDQRRGGDRGRRRETGQRRGAVLAGRPLWFSGRDRRCHPGWGFARPVVPR